MNNYARADLALVKGEGAYVYGSDGRRYLDFCSGIAVTALGHGHPALVKVMQDMADKVWHSSNLFRIPEGERLAERLVAHSFADQVFFCNSGVETFEAAVKLARKHFDDIGQPDRWRVITCKGAFHGRSLNAISAAGNEKYMEGFAPHIPGYVNVAFGNLNELRASITDDTAAILYEPIQGEGGIRTADLEFLKATREICDEFGLLLILDEVQCGVGRTGKFYAHEWAGIEPDILMSAKGIGGGFPVGAVLATAEVGKAFQPGTHGTTYGGNALAMACANAVLDVVLEEGFLLKVRQHGDLLRGKLDSLVARYPGVFAEVRGAGLMLGLRCVVPSGDLSNQLREAGLLTVGAAENVLRLLPPLIIGEQEIEEAVGLLEQVAKSYSA
ncbi:aspartate aminotransferase family protein [Rhodovibrionaceae bacterium A322]